MRQAGRYLPEFRKIRKSNSDFIKLCLNPTLSSKISLQPLKRFNLDAAIIFSDILIVPYGLGQKVTFNKTGPKLSKFDLQDFSRMNENKFLKKIEPVYKSIKITRRKLNKEKCLISFVGGPWTLLIYMLDLKKKNNTLNIRKFKKYSNKIDFILKRIDKFLKIHINKQMSSGADALQIFDSWSGLIPKAKLHKYSFNPNKKIVQYCKRKGFPVICFPKGLKKNYKGFVNFVKPNGINIDYDIKPEWARDNLKKVCIQGGLDPKLLLGNEKKLLLTVDKFVKTFSNTHYIFNLGHGILPQTKPRTIEKIIKRVKENEN
tara:strand:- start:725 stop:1675 length:951 start_codon:yes stop_codon:yes gene_type:complete